jgi:hypothetical protein
MLMNMRLEKTLQTPENNSGAASRALYSSMQTRPVIMHVVVAIAGMIFPAIILACTTTSGVITAPPRPHGRAHALCLSASGIA